MKSIWLKIPSTIAVFLSLATLFNLVKGVMYTIVPNLFADVTGVEDAWGAGISALLLSAFSMLFYAVDAVICIRSALMKLHPIFNCILAFSIFFVFVLGIYVITTTLVTTVNVIWFTCYFSIFILEIISLIIYFKDRTISSRPFSESSN